MNKFLSTLLAGAFAFSLGSSAFAADAAKAPEAVKAEAATVAAPAATPAAKPAKKHTSKHVKTAAPATAPAAAPEATPAK
jgi:hypothetical protein